MDYMFIIRGENMELNNESKTLFIPLYRKGFDE